MMKLDQIRAALRDRRPGVVAAATGLHYNTVRDVRDNPEANPTYKVLAALDAYLSGKTATVAGEVTAA